MQLVDSIVRQRDMYRILLSQTTGVVIPLQGRFLCLTLKVSSIWGDFLKWILGMDFAT